MKKNLYYLISKIKLSVILLISFSYQSFSNVTLPALFSDGMILQRNMKIAVWGWADQGETVTISFGGKEYKVNAFPVSGRWTIYLDPMPANAVPQTMVVKGNNVITLKNILIGDVWLCSGQSNMEWKMNMLNHTYDKEIADSENPYIRAVEIVNNTSLQPLEDCKTEGGWKQANAQNTAEFSAVAYFFAKSLYKQYKVPQALILSEWGGTVAEAWTSLEGLRVLPNYLKDFGDWKKSVPADLSAKTVERLYQGWIKTTRDADKGFSKDGRNWADAGINTSDWKTMDLPAYWETAGLTGIDGIVWFRREVEVSKKDAGKDLVLELAKIDDSDSTYFNGVKIGNTDGYNVSRKYIVPGKLVKAGKNIITIRVTDTGGGGGVWGEKAEMKMTVNGKESSLSGTWLYKLSVNQNDLPPNPRQFLGSPNHPTLLYNAMIAPLIPYGIKGAIWYQGESNAGRAYEYRRLLPAMISDWRTRWGQGEFPFFEVQLANYMKAWEKPEESDWAELREAQVITSQKLPSVGMATIIDIGEAGNIHPKNKQDVGNRLALSARKIAYGEENVIHSGPMYQDMVIEGNTIRLTFNSIGSGLTASNGALKGFTIAGDNHQFVWANASIEGNTIVVSSPEVQKPVSVRYAWANNPEGCNLYNQEGLPASPFRTDHWDGITKGK
ncbi:sialate O-acetylesterase [Pseudarcicella hirudinis]|uniref:Sialate O-acetylesterase n=2 Tax=Pseudarcicella hirudinis TaxID=1079859 RepID=A0A1I5QTG6_9BACT|nr:sialate O-acetylesterase [Pseudarcicella hirudinis]SFP49116.1 sialate O-acetylesterase [Pseudarcicella hirudinis]